MARLPSIMLALSLSTGSIAAFHSMSKRTKEVYIMEQHRQRCITLFSMSSQEPDSFGNDNGDAPSDNGTMPAMETSSVRIDYGGSDLTNRFKYKVNALMGAFDPADSSVDNERHSGHILNAMLKFPVEYTFNVVGRTASEDGNDDTRKNEFVEQVRSLVQKATGEADDRILIHITPRGTKFTKLAISVEVQNSEMISAIYEEMKTIEMCVMRF